MKNKVLLLVVTCLLSAVAFAGQPVHVSVPGAPGYTWDIECVVTTADWVTELNSHAVGWTLANSETIQVQVGVVYHCMAFYQSSNTYSSVITATNTTTAQWTSNLATYLQQGYFVLDSWLPPGSGATGQPNYVAFALP